MTLLELAMIGVAIVLVPLLVWVLLWGGEGRRTDAQRPGWRMPGDSHDE